MIGTSTCDSLAPTRCVSLIGMTAGYWSPENAPESRPGEIFTDGFESGDTSNWSGVVD